ncbi:MAG TPA: formate/nitrite transporter family protein, partial [Anaerolineae bacterium]|nr:formate/nitrite transporter family protein [Anaerolineae bacterium]
MAQTKLDQNDKKEVRRRTAPRAAIVYETIRREGEDELDRTTAALIYSGLAAGLSMGFSFLGEALLQAHLPEAPWRPLISKAGYSLGFLIVILGRQQLFTENTLTPILQLLDRLDVKTLMQVLR